MTNNYFDISKLKGNRIRFIRRDTDLEELSILPEIQKSNSNINLFDCLFCLSKYDKNRIKNKEDKLRSDV